MQWFELVGYIASTLVVLTFYMNDMTSLRIAAIFSNVAFLAYGLSLGLGPVIWLHGILLPLNLWRLTRTSNTRDVATRLGAVIARKARAWSEDKWPNARQRLRRLWTTASESNN